ncbi:MAG TPA: LysR family transcriptional regulator [Polyangiaceae bacterium]|nr:LysR family transcriptional regulator [Polyangiaceae bacterium]
MPVDLSGLRAFVAVADARSFRVAGERLGVTRSAVSQNLRRLEDGMGVALVERTTRSVRLTEAGTRLYASARAALGDLERAVDDVRADAATPSGTLRLCVSSVAESFLEASMLARFLELHPGIRVDLTISDDEGDIVAAGFDAGVRLGELIERDMLAVPVSDRQRQLVVASPQYLRRHPAPEHPRELAEHACIGWRPRPDAAPYRWEFTERGRDFDVAVDPRVTTNDMGVMLRLARRGAGLTFGMEETFRDDLARGELVAVLEGFSAPFPGFYLYYPKRTHPSPRLRALIDHVGAQRRSTRARTSRRR